MDDYDIFKEEFEKEYSSLKSVGLLELFLSEKGRPPCYVKKFGITCHRFHETEMDEFIEWIFKMRTKMSPTCRYVIHK